MHRTWIEIELLEDCVFSARAATEGGHASLDRIPGAALLGAAATRLYGDLGADAFTAFHSGLLRFGDGLPLSEAGEVAYPMPYCWHYPKTDRIEEHGRLLRDRITNFLHADRLLNPGENAQPRQMRQGYVTRYGEWVRPRHDLRLKTAIEATTGRAAEGQLFGYDALHRGQRFRALIEADDLVDAALFERVVDALTGEVLLGRSRSAEYGRARIARVGGEPPRPGGPAPDGPAPDGRITLWLLSDLALADKHGQPTLQPMPEHFGLSGGKIVWDRTFLRPRRYSPWNAARGGFDRERLVLTAGGVITLEPPEGYDRKALIDRLARGVGLHREAGLGRLWLDPPLLAKKQPDFRPLPDSQDGQGARVAPPKHTLAEWLQNQGGGWKLEAEQATEAFVEEYHKIIERARNFGGIREDAVFGPSRSQWGQVLAKARASRGSELYDALFKGEDALIKTNGEGWDIEITRNQRLVNWLKDHLNPKRFEQGARIPHKDRHRAYAHFVRIAARRIQDDIRRRRS